MNFIIQEMAISSYLATKAIMSLVGVLHSLLLDPEPFPLADRKVSRQAGVGLFQRQLLQGCNLWIHTAERYASMRYGICSSQSL